MKKVREITKWKAYRGERHDNSLWDSPKDGPHVLYKQLPVLLSIINQNEKKNKDVIFRIIKRNFEERDISSPRLSDSRIGTIVALGRKFGFIKAKKLMLTNAGESALSNYKKTIQKQYIKLIFNNPLLTKSIGIKLFPIIELFKILKKTKYLTRDEMAIFIFSQLKKESETQDAINKIFRFRKLPKEDKQEKLDLFLKTHKGNITIGKASSVSYLISNLTELDYFQKREQEDTNVISLTKINEVNKILNKYKNIKPYNFKDNEELWEKYYTNIKIDFPPEEVCFKFKAEVDISFSIRNNIYEDSKDLINENSIKIPIFKELKNTIEIISLENSNKSFKKVYEPNTITDIEDVKVLHFSKRYSIDDLLEFYKTSGVDPILKSMKQEVTPSLKGARFEYLVYEKLKSVLKSRVSWNGWLSNSVPRSAIRGNPDIVVETENVFYIVEVTTMKTLSCQETNETFSLIRHAELFLNRGKKVCIIFISPIKHASLTQTMGGYAASKNMEYKNIDIDKLKEDCNKIFI